MKCKIYLVLVMVIMFLPSGVWAQDIANITEPELIKEKKGMKATARHILVESKQECEELKAQIEAGADFAMIAQEYSRCPSGQSGGDLGEFGPGLMVKEFDEVVFSAEPGKVHGPVKTDFGFHLIEITSRTEE